MVVLGPALTEMQALLAGRIDAPSEYRNHAHGNDGSCQSSVHGGHCSLDQKMSMKARQNGPRLGQQTHGSYSSARRTVGRLLSLETNSWLIHPRVPSLSEVGEASAELVSDDLSVLYWRNDARIS